jgi:chromosome segregation ATPase
MVSNSSFFKIFKDSMQSEPARKDAVASESGKADVNAQAAAQRASQAQAAAAPARKPVELEDDLPRSIADTMKQMGSHDEELRVRCEKIVELTRIVQLLPQELSSVFLNFNTVAGNLAVQRRLLDETNTSLDATRMALSNREAEIVHLRDGLSGSEQKITELTGLVGELRDRCGQLEDRIEDLLDTNNEKALQLRSKDYAIEQLQAEVESLRNELNAARDKLKEQEKALLEAASDKILLREQLAHQVDERDQLAKSFEALNVEANQMRRQALATSAELDDLRSKFGKLDAEAQVVFTESKALREALINAETLHAQSVQTYESKVAAMNSRLRVSEELLSQSRAEARKLSEEQLASYKRVRELEDLPAKLSESNRNVESNLRMLKEAQLDNDKLRTKIADLNEKLVTKDRLNQQAAERIGSLQESLSRSQKERETREGELRKQIEAREETIAKERTERAYIEGVLETARRDRSQLHKTIVELRARMTSASTSAVVNQSMDEYLEDMDDLKSMLRESEQGVVNLRKPKESGKRSQKPSE